MFQGNATNRQESAWTLLLAQAPPPSQEDARLDTRIAMKLFTVIRHGISEADSGAMSPIHRAMVNGLIGILPRTAWCEY